MADQHEANHVNWGEAFDYMQNVEDQAVKNMLGLFYASLIRADNEGVRPAAPFDLLYCFKLLELACSNKAELFMAVRGDVPNLGEPPDWI